MHSFLFYTLNYLYFYFGSKNFQIEGLHIFWNLRKFSFVDCKSITSLSLPNSSKVVFSKSSFCGCESIYNIAVISRQEFTAGEYCFSRAKKLSYFIVESSKVSLGDLCFNQCSSLSTVSFPTASEINLYSSPFKGLKNIGYGFNPNAKK